MATDDFEAMIAHLRAVINESADDLYRRIVEEMREYVVTLCALRDKPAKDHITP